MRCTKEWAASVQLLPLQAASIKNNQSKDSLTLNSETLGISPVHERHEVLLLLLLKSRVLGYVPAGGILSVDSG